MTPENPPTEFTLFMRDVLGFADFGEPTVSKAQPEATLEAIAKAHAKGYDLCIVDPGPLPIPKMSFKTDLSDPPPTNLDGLYHFRKLGHLPALDSRRGSSFDPPTMCLYCHCQEISENARLPCTGTDLARFKALFDSVGLTYQERGHYLSIHGYRPHRTAVEDPGAARYYFMFDSTGKFYGHGDRE